MTWDVPNAKQLTILTTISHVYRNLQTVKFMTYKPKQNAKRALMECTGAEHHVSAVLLSMLNVLLAKMVNSVMNVIQASGTFKRRITSRVDSQRQIAKFMT